MNVVKDVNKINNTEDSLDPLLNENSSSSINYTLNKNMVQENQLNDIKVSQKSSNYHTISNIIPSPIQTLNKPREFLKSDFDYTIKYLVADDNNVTNFTPSSIQHDRMGNKLKEKSIREYNRRKEELHEFYQKLLRTINDSINIIKAVVMRLVFSLHSLIAISYVYVVKRDEWYFVNVVGVVFLLIELFITIIKRRGHEPTGFFPSFFIYICTMIPPIWFVELSRIDQANRARAKAKIKQNSDSNLTSEWNNHQVEHEETDHFVHLSETLGLNESLGLGIKINEAIPLNTTTIAVYLEISLMILIILGRWFLPKGDLSRSALSQLLLVYMSLGSDMIDLLSLLNEPNVQESSIMTYFTLSIFSWSMFQFSLNLVVNRGRSFVIEKDPNEEDNLNERELKTEFEEFEENDGSNSFIQNLETYVRKHDQTGEFKNEKEKKVGCIPKRYMRMNVFDSEMWSILITMIFQDGPFLGIRLAAVIRFEVRTFVTFEATKDQNADKTTKDDALASLKAASLQLDKFVILSYKRDLILKKLDSKKNFKKSNIDKDEDILQAENTLFEINPIIIKSSLSKQYSYSINLTPSLSTNLLNSEY